VLALALLAAVAALALWLGRRGDPTPVHPAAPTPAADSTGGGPAPAGPVDVALRGPVSLDQRGDQAPQTPDGEAPVELWVRVVETVALQPRPGELRPTRRGVPGMDVTWDGTRQAVSDADGLARFEGLAPRAGLLSVAPQGGLHGWSGTLDLARPSGGLRRGGRRLTYELELRVHLGFFGGRLLDARGAPVADAWVALVRGGAGERRSPGDADLLAPALQRAADGAFELPRVQGEERLELLIAIERAGLPAGHVRVLSTTELASPLPLEVRLPEARAVRVRVLAADGAPAPGRLCLQRDGALWPADCEPRLAHTGAALAARARPRASGAIELELADGPWVVHYLPDAPGESRRLFQFTLAPAGASEFEFRLP
jgi:hypothetical protein